jgi:L-iditol 2-dehydrogenase
VSAVLAGQLVAPGRLEVVEAPVPSPANGQVLVRARRASICGSDLHIVYDGYYRGEYPAPPGYPGHEGVGQVLESRAPGFTSGDWVLAVPAPPTAGCFAEQHVVNADALIALPPGGDPDRLLLAQQLGTTIFAFRRFWPGLGASGRSVAICGAGSAGLFFAQLARLAGFETVIVADAVALRLRIAEAFGADVVVDIARRGFVDAVLEATDGRGADLVIEAVGTDETRIQCLKAVRREGRIGYFGFPEHPTGTSAWSFVDAWVKKPTIEVVNGTQAEPGLRSFREALDLIASARVNVDSFLTPVFALADVGAAFEAARDKRGGKIAIELDPHLRPPMSTA